MEQQGYRGPPGPAQGTFLEKGGREANREHDLPAVGHADWRRELRRAILSRVVPRLSDFGREQDAASAARSARAARPAGALTDAQVSTFSDMVLAAAVPGRSNSWRRRHGASATCGWRTS